MKMFKVKALLVLMTVLFVGTVAQAQGVRPDGSYGDFTAKFVDVKGVDTRYYETGSGDVVVLIHGAGFSGTSSANTWMPTLPHLAKSFHVYAPDKLASGGTGNPIDDKDFTIQGETQHIYDFIQTLKLGKVHVVGQSRGGGVALFLAMFHPEVVQTLTIIDSQTAAPEVGDYNARRDKALAKCGPDRESHEYWVCNMKSLSFDPSHVDGDFIAAAKIMVESDKAKETQTRLAAARAAGLNAGWGGAAYMKWKDEQFARIRAEGLIKMPTLLYWGRNDPTAIPEQGLALYDVIGAKNPNVRFVQINNAGHFHYREHPQEFAQNLTHWIKQWAPTLEAN